MFAAVSLPFDVPYRQRECTYQYIYLSVCLSALTYISPGGKLNYILTQHQICALCFPLSPFDFGVSGCHYSRCCQYAALCVSGCTVLPGWWWWWWWRGVPKRLSLSVSHMGETATGNSLLQQLQGEMIKEWRNANQRSSTLSFYTTLSPWLWC